MSLNARIRNALSINPNGENISHQTVINYGNASAMLLKPFVGNYLTYNFAQNLQQAFVNHNKLYHKLRNNYCCYKLILNKK